MGPCGQRLLALWQREEIRAVVRPGWVSALVWGRQSGKSLMFCLAALWVAFTRPGSLTMIVSGGGEQGGRRIVADARRVLAGSPLLTSSVVEETSSLVRLDNGSVIRAVAASDSAIRGWSVDALLVDEAQLLSDELLLSAALPTVLAREGAFVAMAGTAGRAEGAFFDMFRQGETGVEGVRASRRVSRLVGGEDEMPWQNPTMMSRLAAAMGPTRIDAELKGIFATGSNYMFAPAELDTVTADYVADTLDTMRGPAGVFGGLDLAVAAGGDTAAFVAIGRPVVPDAGGAIFAVRCAHAWQSGHPLMSPEGGTRGVFETIAASPMVLESLRVDATGMQGGFSSYLAPLLRRRPVELGGGRKRPSVVLVEEDPYAEPRARPRQPTRPLATAVQPTDFRGISFSAGMKQAAFGALRMVTQRELLLYPASAVELRRQMLALKVGLSRSGGETFEAESGAHDDLPDALVLAMRPYRRPDGAWRTIVGDLAERAAPQAAPAGSDQVAFTSSGLRVPRRPTWIGMTTRGVTETERAPAASTGPNLALARAAVRAATRTNGDPDGR